MMNLRLIREPSLDSATLGSLYVDRVWFCWTLEDQLRELVNQPVASWKIAGQTAIPAGRYRVQMAWSERFQRSVPHLLNVSGFTAIEIHGGNRPADTEGCVLVGLSRSNAQIANSANPRSQLEALITAADETWITIENPPEA